MKRYGRRTGELKKHFMIIMKPSLITKVDYFANIHNTSRSNLIEECLHIGLGQYAMIEEDEQQMERDEEHRKMRARWGGVKRWHPEVSWERWLKEQEAKAENDKK